MDLKVTNPYSQETVCTLPFADERQIARAIDRTETAFRRWRRVPVAERVAIVREGLDRFQRRAEDVARDVTLQMGRPIVQSRSEFKGMMDRAEYMMSIAEETLSPDILPPKPGFRRRIEHVPLGVVLNVAAWNYPLLIPINVVVPALLAGNTVILKHSAKTPLCGKHFAEAFGELEIPNLVANLVIDHEQTGRVIADPRVAHVAFTGSVEGGRRIHRHVAERFIDAGLELGGNDPAYVAEDADLDFSAENVVDGACYNAGQSCCAVERVYVHRSLYDAFLEKSLAVMKNYRLGDPMDQETTMGPLATRGALDVLQKQVEDAVARGGRLLLGGRPLAGSPGNFFEPTLLADVPNDAVVMQEESFGPLMPVLAVADDDEAIAMMNDTHYGLTASVWTRDPRRADRFGREVEAGTIYQNRCDFLDPALPWTGYRDSGKGSTLSRYGFFHLTKRKSIHFRTLE
ncbi:MAG: aldehyde dehydrogenase family protein [Planctomycetia bacterium]|nr:aldehyde dehydrogenase family protein [Planctomycetia bacterium]